MNITEAKRLTKGSCVRCPADRGDAAYDGVVHHVSPDVFTNFQGREYLWVTVNKHDNTRHVWPSNRLI